MSSGRPHRSTALSGLGATLGLLVLIVGVPVALGLAVGWPLPHGLPRVSEISTALRDLSYVPDRFWIGLAALVAWLAWVQVAGAALVELVAALAHRPTPHLPVFAAPARHLARRLVSSATLVGMLVTSRPALAHPRLRPPAAVAVEVGTGAPPAAATVTRPSETAVLGINSDAARRVYVVEPWEATRDCLWTIAERHLGDPLRWREIWELNRDRLQADGAALSEPDLILPGWELVLPADAVGLAPVIEAPAASGSAPPPATGTAPAHIAAPPTTAAVPRTAPVATTIAVTTTAAVPSTTAAAAPTTAAVPATAAAGEESPPAPSASPVTGRAPSGGLDLPFGKTGAQALRYGMVGLPVVAAGGFILALNRRRRAQVAACRPGRDIRRPDPESEPLERQLRAIAAEDASEWVDAAMRALATALRNSRPRHLPDIVAVRAGDLGVEVLLSSPDDDAPSPWEAADDGFVWRLDAGIDLPELQRLGAGHASTSPALVSLGASPEGPLLVDLEALGALSVEGDTDRVAAFLAGVALELACAPWAQGVELRVLGASAAMANNDAVSILDHPDGLEEELAGLMEATRESLGERPSTLAGRLDRLSGDDWPPTVVVVARPGSAPAETLERLAALTRSPGAGAVLVAPGPLLGARWRLIIGTDATATLEPLGLSVHAAGVADAILASQGGLDEAVIDAAAALLATAADVDDVAPLRELPTAAAPRRRARRLEPEVWAAVIGPPEVTGWGTPIGQRRKFTELVCYLATHDERPVPGERLHAACWPSVDAASYASFKETVSRVRRHLGDDSRGRRHLPPAVASAYQLGPYVGCDWRWFQDTVAEAGRVGPDEALRLYREALSLVRGEPFAGTVKGTYVWAWSEGLVYTIEVAVARAASAMGQLALDHADPEAARWASAQGLLACPTQQSLFRVEMRAAADLADTDGVTRAMEAATRAHQSVDPETDPPAETVELYRHLMGRRGGARTAVSATS